jgi:hypothetical protein
MARWFKTQWLQINLGTFLWLFLLIGMWLAWWRDHNAMDRRIAKLEQQMFPTQMWSIEQCFGPPNDPTGRAALSWCPLPSTSQEWLQVEFDKAIRPASIVVHETYSIGALTRVSVFDNAGNEVTVWSGTQNKSGSVGTFTCPTRIDFKTRRVKLYLNNTNWSCIDAVGLSDANGKTTWATGATASSTYGSPGRNMGYNPNLYYAQSPNGGFIQEEQFQVP